MKLEQAVALDISATGRTAVLDRGGLRLTVDFQLTLDAPARRCRFRGEDLVLLGAHDLATVGADGKPIGAVPIRPGATDLAVMASGSVVVSYGPDVPDVTFERFGDAPLVHRDDALLHATCLAAESGGLWVAGTAPANRAICYQPARTGLRERERVELSGHARVASIGPDGALYLLMDPGTTLVRCFGHQLTTATLRDPLHGLARGERSLWGVGAGGLVDLTAHVPPRAP